MNWLQIRLFGPYFSSFSTNSYGYYSQMSQNLFSNNQTFASALIVRQAAREPNNGETILLNSMTGYGKGESVCDGLTVTVELKNDLLIRGTLIECDHELNL